MSEIKIARGYSPGSIGRVTEMHAAYYHRHWNFGLFFEAKVATELSEFLKRYDRSRDSFWTILVNDHVEGSISIDGIDAENKGAHLRWFIISEGFWGQGLGKRLITNAINFCRSKTYEKIYLWTFEGLDTAKHLYEKSGFKLVENREGSQWGIRVNEQRYECSLKKAFE